MRRTACSSSARSLTRRTRRSICSGPSPPHDRLGWITTHSGRVRAFVLKSTNVRLGTFYAFLEDLEQKFFSDNPEGIEIRINTKGPRS